MKVRLQKYLAEAGIASRRASEALILAGHVTVNGRPVTQLGTRVDPDADAVRCHSDVVRPRRKLHVAINKPTGYVCSRQAERGQLRVNDLLPREWNFLYPVGRLDRDTEGLLFLTNDGDFCLRLTHPRYGVRKHYLATLQGRVDPPVLARLRTGVIHEGERLQAQRVRLMAANASRSVVELELNEGKHHEVRRLFQSLGFPVLALRRTRIGPIKLGELPVGKYRVLTASEVQALNALTPAPGQPPPERRLPAGFDRPQLRSRGGEARTAQVTPTRPWARTRKAGYKPALRPSSLTGSAVRSDTTGPAAAKSGQRRGLARRASDQHRFASL